MGLEGRMKSKAKLIDFSGPFDTDLARTALEAAHEMVSALCKRRGAEGAREWIMSIPARPRYDPDLVIGAGLRAGDAALREVTALRARVAELEAERDAAGNLVCEAWSIAVNSIGRGPIRAQDGLAGIKAMLAEIREKLGCECPQNRKAEPRAPRGAEGE
jgi:hypothetical protein